MVYEHGHMYKGVRVNSFGIPLFLLGGDIDSDIRIKKENRKNCFYNKTFVSPFKKSSTKNLIVMYDIPNDKKKERDWFRRHLIKFGYILIQKSVWVGPSPLPKKFMKYIEVIGLKKNLKTFKLTKGYTGEDSNI